MRHFHHVFAPEPDDGSALCVCALGHAANKSMYRSVDDGRPVYVFLFFHTQAFASIRGIRSRLPAMSFLAFPPHTPLCYGDEKGYRHSWMTVRGSTIDELVRRHTVPLFTAVTISDPLIFDDCQHAADTELLSHENPHEGILKNIIGKLFLELGRAQEVKSGAIVHRFMTVRRYIDIHYMERIRLGDLAGMAGLSVSRFSGEFKKEFMLSPIDYLIRKRLDEAQHLLTVSTASVESIAADVGFSDVAHFSKTFSQRVGISPLAFRRRKKTQKTR